MAKIGPSDVPGIKLGPNGSFPAGDPKHQRLAIQMAPKSEHAGNINHAEEQHIVHRARALLNKSGKSYSGLAKGHKVAD